MSSLRLAITAIVLSAALSGCQTGEVKAVVPIAGGGQIIVPMSAGGPPAGEAEGFKVVASVLQPGKEERQAYYEFALSNAKGAPLSRVLVEDISDEKATTLVDDTAPQFTNGRWTRTSENLTADDRRLQWVMQITMSMRVYRFTLTAKDGHVITFNHVAVYPPFYKTAVRSKWGEKY